MRLPAKLSHRGPRPNAADAPSALIGDLECSEPDLETRAILGILNLGNQPQHLDKMSVNTARRDLRLAAAAAGTREEVGRVRDTTVPGPDGPIPIRVYEPAGASAPLPVFVWIHGGGFVLGCLDMADGTCRAIANRSGAAVVSIDYRLAPEHDLSAGRRDCIATVEWIAKHANTLGFDGRLLAVGGDSAGGNLAAVVAQHCAKNGPKLALQVLAYPATDLRIDYSDKPYAEGYLLSRAVMEWLKNQIPDDLAAEDPWLSPALAPSLKGVAPALVITAGCDPLRGDGLAYIERLRDDGVRVESLHYPGQIHGFITFDLLLHAGRDALQHIGSSLAAVFGRPRPAVPGTAGLAADSNPVHVIGRKLIEHHFDQMVIGLLMFDAHRAVVRDIIAALRRGAYLAPFSFAPIPSPGSEPRTQRFRPGIGNAK
jgi:acetyl esterase